MNLSQRLLIVVTYGENLVGRKCAASEAALFRLLRKLQLGRAYGNLGIALLLAVVALGLLEQVLASQSSIFREFQAALLSLQWMLLACLSVWCGTFLYLTFRRKDLLLIVLLLVAGVYYFTGTAKFSQATDALILVAGVTLGRGARFWCSSRRESALTKISGTENQHAEAGQSELTSAANLLMGLVLLLSFAAWWHLAPTGTYRGPRWMGCWNNPNIYGMLMGAGIVLAIGLLAAKAGCRMCKMEILIRGIAIFMLGVGLVMSCSRGAWLATGLAIVYLAWCYGKLKCRYVLSVVAVVVVVVIYHWGSTPDHAPWYVKRADLGRPSAQNRVIAWRAGLEIMRDHPLGVGWNKAVSIYGEKYNPPEGGPAALTTNDYLMLGTELGIPALLCFVAYVGLCYRRSPRIQKLGVRRQEAENVLSFQPSPPVGAKEDNIGNSSPMTYPPSLQECEALRAACLAGALVFVVAFWFDGGLFKLPTAALFWVLLELGAYRSQKVDGEELMVDKLSQTVESPS